MIYADCLSLQGNPISFYPKATRHTAVKVFTSAPVAAAAPHAIHAQNPLWLKGAPGSHDYSIFTNCTHHADTCHRAWDKGYDAIVFENSASGEIQAIAQEDWQVMPVKAAAKLAEGGILKELKHVYKPEQCTDLSDAEYAVKEMQRLILKYPESILLKQRYAALYKRKEQLLNEEEKMVDGGQLQLFEQITPASEKEIEAVPDDNFRGTPLQVETQRLLNPNPQLTMFSFGGGQDSWCILYKLIHDADFRKKYAPNDLVIAMSDTGNEFPYTYKYLQQAIELAKQHGIDFQFITPDQGYHTPGWQHLKYNLRKNDNILSATMQRQPCTVNLKINVVDKFMHAYMMQKYFPGVDAKNKNGWRLYKEKFKTKARVLIGFARDEEARVIKSHRMHMAKDSAGKPLLPKWKIENMQYCYPLIEEGWNRAAAQEIILQYRHDLPPPSNCMICFYQSDQELIWLERNYPLEFYDWVELEKKKLEKFAHKGDKNYGVYGTITLIEKLEQAKKKYGHWSNEQLWEYKMSHGHCVKSVY